jgi:hypothetical protein
MAEGLIGGILGDEDEKPEVEAAEALTSAHARFRCLRRWWQVPSVLAFFIMINDAVTSRQVVVEPFAVPPSLAPHGLTGKVVAGAVLDELSRLQSATRSNAVARGLSGAWTSDIKLEVPEMGLSVSEISRRSDSDMTCISTETSLRPKRAISH